MSTNYTNTHIVLEITLVDVDEYRSLGRTKRQNQLLAIGMLVIKASPDTKVAVWIIRSRGVPVSGCSGRRTGQKRHHIEIVELVYAQNDDWGDGVIIMWGLGPPGNHYL